MTETSHEDNDVTASALCHKIILSTQCDPLQAALSFNAPCSQGALQADQETSKRSFYTVTLKGMASHSEHKDLLQVLLRYLYGGCDAVYENLMTHLSPSEIVALLKVSDELFLEPLKCLCELVLVKVYLIEAGKCDAGDLAIVFSNAEALLPVAELYNASCLRDHCHDVLSGGSLDSRNFSPDIVELETKLSACRYQSFVNISKRMFGMCIALQTAGQSSDIRGAGCRGSYDILVLNSLTRDRFFCPRILLQARCPQLIVVDSACNIVVPLSSKATQLLGQWICAGNFVFRAPRNAALVNVEVMCEILTFSLKHGIGNLKESCAVILRNHHCESPENVGRILAAIAKGGQAESSISTHKILEGEQNVLDNLANHCVWYFLTMLLKASDTPQRKANRSPSRVTCSKARAGSIHGDRSSPANPLHLDLVLFAESIDTLTNGGSIRSRARSLWNLFSMLLPSHAPSNYLRRAVLTRNKRTSTRKPRFLYCVGLPPPCRHPQPADLQDAVRIPATLWAIISKPPRIRDPPTHCHLRQPWQRLAPHSGAGAPCSFEGRSRKLVPPEPLLFAFVSILITRVFGESDAVRASPLTGVEFLSIGTVTISLSAPSSGKESITIFDHLSHHSHTHLHASKYLRHRARGA